MELKKTYPYQKQFDDIVWSSKQYHKWTLRTWTIPKAFELNDRVKNTYVSSYCFTVHCVLHVKIWVTIIYYSFDRRKQLSLFWWWLQIHWTPLGLMTIPRWLAPTACWWSGLLFLMYKCSFLIAFSYGYALKPSTLPCSRTQSTKYNQLWTL